MYSVNEERGRGSERQCVCKRETKFNKLFSMQCDNYLQHKLCRVCKGVNMRQPRVSWRRKVIQCEENYVQLFELHRILHNHRPVIE